jgi:LuxR family transcriptional regulator, quorum-sensing system regulator CciR
MCVVKPFELAEFFMEQHGRKVPLPELKSSFATALKELGVRYFACCPHVDPLNPRNADLVFQNYPDEWVRYYSESGRFRIDPVFRFADERMVPFHWNDPEFRASLTAAQREMLIEGAGYGLVNGYTVPVRPPGAQTASCSVVPDSLPGIDPATGQAVFVMASFMFDAMLRAKSECSGVRSIVLSERERQCLELAAQGKDDWAIGLLLRISERTAHNHIERAKRRLGVCTRVQVIVQALSEGQISFGDVIRVQPRRESERELRNSAN